MYLNYFFLVQKVLTYLFNLISPDLNQNITIFCHKDPMSCRQYVEFCINILLYQPTHIHGHKTTKVCTQKVSNIPGNDSRLNSNSRCNSCLISHTQPKIQTNDTRTTTTKASQIRTPKKISRTTKRWINILTHKYNMLC